jgi:hypothetical protein
MKCAHRLILLSATAALGLAASVAQAATVSIGDLIDGQPLTLQVAAPTSITSPGNPPAGTGVQMDLLHPANPINGANGISNINYNQANETLAFTFANQIAWGSNVFFYQYYNEPGGGLSDLFVIQGIGGQNPDWVTFVSDPGQLTGNPVADLAAAGFTPITNATPVNLGNASETGGFQLAFNTGVDQYFIASDTPGPIPGAGLAGLATLALAGLYAKTRRA